MKDWRSEINSANFWVKYPTDNRYEGFHVTLGGISCYQTCCLLREIALFIEQFIPTFHTMNEEKNMKNYFSCVFGHSPQ